MRARSQGAGQKQGFVRSCPCQPHSSGGFGFLLTVRTNPRKSDRIVEKAKISRLIGAECEHVEGRVVDVTDRSAVDTDEMMMSACIGIEAGFGLKTRNPAHKAYANQRVKNPVDGCSGKALKLHMQFLVELIGRGVVLSPRQSSQYGTPLRCLAEAVAPAGFVKFQLFAKDEIFGGKVGSFAHVWYFIASGIICQQRREIFFHNDTKLPG